MGLCHRQQLPAQVSSRQIRHEKKVLTTAKEKAAQYDYDGAISLLQKTMHM
ncbi:MAG: hypothetical protein ACLRMZ_27380 [Blautia marasmi]